MLTISEATTPWYVHVFVRGHYSGAYEFPTRQAAKEDWEERSKTMTIFGCSYIVSQLNEHEMREEMDDEPTR